MGTAGLTLNACVQQYDTMMAMYHVFRSIRYCCRACVCVLCHSIYSRHYTLHSKLGAAVPGIQTRNNPRRVRKPPPQHQPLASLVYFIIPSSDVGKGRHETSFARWYGRLCRPETSTTGGGPKLAMKFWKGFGYRSKSQGHSSQPLAPSMSSRSRAEKNGVEGSHFHVHMNGVLSDCEVENKSCSIVFETKPLVLL